MKTASYLAMAALASAMFVSTQTSAQETKNMTVFKTPWCGCCKVWSDAMQKAGFTVTEKNMSDLSLIRKQASVTDEIAGCHTAILGDYVLEGHVPLQAIDKLLAEKPDIRGLAVPGMPSGSLGMVYDENAQYNVYSFERDTSIKPEIFYQAGKI
ncbi:MAG: DUF411 domain-containing protein [Rhizobiaceae bacterium]|nr:DUF411 domain-containing protein [Rhizobiaceae bacterium]